MRQPMKKMLCLLALALALTGCGRESFADSLSRDPQTASSGGSSGQASSQKPAAGDSFEIDVEELTDPDGRYVVYYALPVGEGDNRDAAEKISKAIETALFALPDYLASDGSGKALEVVDSITRNDGAYFSTCYELYVTGDDADEKYVFGLVFNAVTGDLIGADAFIDIEQLAVLLLDEQSSQIIDRNEQRAASKRRYLGGLTAEDLSRRLVYPDGVISLKGLLDASVYLDGKKLVAVFSADDSDIGDVIQVSVQI